MRCTDRVGYMFSWGISNKTVGYSLPSLVYQCLFTLDIVAPARLFPDLALISSYVLNPAPYGERVKTSFLI